MREAAEGLNYAVMDLIDKLDDNPTPAIGSPSDQSQFSKQRESTPGDPREVLVTPKGDVVCNGEAVNPKEIEDEGDR